MTVNSGHFVVECNDHNLTVNAGRGIWADEDGIELTVKILNLLVVLHVKEPFKLMV